MSASPSCEKEIKQWVDIDKYSIKAIGTIAVDIWRAKHAEKRFNENGDIEFKDELFGDGDIYPSEYAITDDEGNVGYFVNDWLYEAMTHLELRQKKVIILEFWYGYSRREIAEKLNVSVGTVTNIKNKAFNYIRGYKERMIDSDIRGP